MGYTTDFDGAIAVSPPLNATEIAYLRKFNETRRMDRERGSYFVGGTGDFGQGSDPDIRNYNAPPSDQPGLWCQWTPSDDGETIVWDEGEKFYDAPEWMTYLIDHFLRPDAHASAANDPQFVGFTFDHVCSGEIYAQGEDPDDKWRLVVDNNAVRVQTATTTYED